MISRHHWGCSKGFLSQPNRHEGCESNGGGGKDRKKRACCFSYKQQFCFFWKTTQQKRITLSKRSHLRVQKQNSSYEQAGKILSCNKNVEKNILFWMNAIFFHTYHNLPQIKLLFIKENQNVTVYSNSLIFSQDIERLKKSKKLTCGKRRNHWETVRSLVQLGKGKKQIRINSLIYIIIII